MYNKHKLEKSIYCYNNSKKEAYLPPARKVVYTKQESVDSTNTNVISQVIDLYFQMVWKAGFDKLMASIYDYYANINCFSGDLTVMFEELDKEEPSYKIIKKSEWVRYYIDLPGVIEPDIDVEIAELEIVIRALRTLPESKIFTCSLSVPFKYSSDEMVIKFEWGVLEISIHAKGD